MKVKILSRSLMYLNDLLSNIFSGYEEMFSVQRPPNKMSNAQNLLWCLKVAELKKELADRGLPTKGNKSDLLARLEKCLSEQGETIAILKLLDCQELVPFYF